MWYNLVCTSKRRRRKPPIKIILYLTTSWLNGHFKFEGHTALWDSDIQSSYELKIVIESKLLIHTLLGQNKLLRIFNRIEQASLKNKCWHSHVWTTMGHQLTTQGLWVSWQFCTTLTVNNLELNIYIVFILSCGQVSSCHLCLCQRQCLWHRSFYFNHRSTITELTCSLYRNVYIYREYRH